MAGTVTRKQAEGYWNKYNKDKNECLTVDEVKQCVQEVFEEEYDDSDLQAQYVFFGQKEPKDLGKEEFIEGMMRTQRCKALEKAFKEMDKDNSNSLSKEELEAGLRDQGFDKKVADVILEELEFDDDNKYNIKEFLEVVAFGEYFSKSYDV